MADARADIIALSDHVYQRTRGRLAGLTDEEYFWEPVPGCWTVRRADSGYLADGGGEPGTPPFTTIAWRLWHLIGCYGAQRNSQWLGVERRSGRSGGRYPAPATAASAIATLEREYAFWQELLYALPADSWWDKMGVIAGPFAELDKASLVLHQLDEQIHHGAELGVLRDLYAHRR
jgi:DinB superfamily